MFFWASSIRRVVYYGLVNIFTWTKLRPETVLIHLQLWEPVSHGYLHDDSIWREYMILYLLLASSIASLYSSCWFECSRSPQKHSALWSSIWEGTGDVTISPSYFPNLFSLFRCGKLSGTYRGNYAIVIIMGIAPPRIRPSSILSCAIILFRISRRRYLALSHSKSTRDFNLGNCHDGRRWFREE